MRVPVAVALGIVGFAGYAAIEGWQKALLVLGNTPFDIASGYALSVVPLFILMGAVASEFGMSAKLFKATKSLFNGFRGAEAMATIGACAGFAAVCGSSLATAATMSRIAIPEMRAAGYDDRLSTGVVAAGGTLGILLPPSIIFVIYAIIAQQSVLRLFAAGLIPGLVLMVLYMLVVGILVVVRPAWAKSGQRSAPAPAPARHAGDVGDRAALLRVDRRHVCGPVQPDRSGRDRRVRRLPARHDHRTDVSCQVLEMREAVGPDHGDAVFHHDRGVSVFLLRRADAIAGHLSWRWFAKRACRPST